MNYTHKTQILTFIIISFLLSACGGNTDSTPFTEAENLIAYNPEEGVRFLDSLGHDEQWLSGLSEEEKARFSLLRVKANDKAFVDHTSDSLIRQALDYYGKRPETDLYAEALYYGGRVSADLGDSPAALKYFQQSINTLKKNPNNQLYPIVLSQTARLLNSRRVDKEAIRYIEKAIQIEERQKDSLGLLEDTEFAGAIHLHLGNYDQAEQMFRKSLSMAERFDSTFVTLNKMQLAAIRYCTNRNDSALAMIRPILNTREPSLRRSILVYACDIYKEAGKYDSAYMYARELLSSPYAHERKSAFSVLVDPALSSYVSRDSLWNYIEAYREILEQTWDDNENKQIFVQNSQYNYDNKEKDRLKAEQKTRQTFIWLSLAVSCSMILVGVIIWMRKRSRRQRIELLRAFEDIETLKEYIDRESEAMAHRDNIPNGPDNTESSGKTGESENVEKRDEAKSADNIESSEPESARIHNSNDDTNNVGPSSITDTPNSDPTQTEQTVSDNNEDSTEQKSISDDIKESFSNQELRGILRMRLLEIQENSDNKYTVPTEISGSEVYKKLMQYVSEHKGIPDNSSIWEELEPVITNSSKDFLKHLELLIGRKPTLIQKKVCFLVKCGLRPSEMCTILNKTKGAVSSSRGYISLKIYGKKLENPKIDGIIRLL